MFLTHRVCRLINWAGVFWRFYVPEACPFVTLDI